MAAPSKALLSIEGIRSIYEYLLGWALSVPLQYISPAGDGHPVMVLPGLGAADGSTHYIRNHLYKLGYDTHPWGMGRNLGPRNGIDAMLSQLANRVQVIYEQSGQQQVSIIGWSLGGIYAREIAKLVPDNVRQVITLGTPFKGGSSDTNASLLYEILSRDSSHRDPNILKRISNPPPVPFTSIYSKSDGVVNWQASIEEVSPTSENIEIPGASHLGLGHNPIAMYVVAERLTQAKETWEPYRK